MEQYLGWMGWIGWIVAAFLAGVMAMQWIQHRRPSLRQKVSQIGSFAGKAYVQILRELAVPQTEHPQRDGGVLRTWYGRDYCISLLFDEQDMCLGVMEESD